MDEILSGEHAQKEEKAKDRILRAGKEEGANREDSEWPKKGE